MANIKVYPFDAGPKQNVDIHASEGNIECRVARKLGLCTRHVARAICGLISNPPWRTNCGLQKSGNRLR